MKRRSYLAAAGFAGLVGVLAVPATSSATPKLAELSHLASYDSGSGEAGAEIVAYDATTKTMLVTNGRLRRVDIVSLADPSSPVQLRSVDLTSVGADVQSVAAHKGLGVAVVTGATVLDPGRAVFFDIATGEIRSTVPTGVLPDAVSWSKEGDVVVIANEGEPRCVTGPTRTPTRDPRLAENPEGSVTVIEVRGGGRNLSARQVTFERFNSPEATAALVAKGVRVGTWPGSTAAQDLEPEYPTIVGKTAYVTLQENNAVAVVDLAAAKVIDIVALGTKDHSTAGNAIDASDRDAAFRQQNWPVRGMFQPDGIDSLRFQGRTYLVTANEGDTRTYFSGIENAEVSGNECFADEARVRSLTLDPAAFGGSAAVTSLRDNANLGRLKVTSVAPSTNSANGFTSLVAFGGRSLSVWDDAGRLVWDSASLFESLVHAADGGRWVDGSPVPPWATSAYDTRSDDKGPEPEGITVGEHKGRTYAFVGLERAGGVVVFDVTDPRAPAFLQWLPVAGDISPEGLTFVPGSASPTATPLLLVANEISGTTTVFELRA